MLLVIGVYSLSLKGPLYFDDVQIITENLKIKDLSPKTLIGICFNDATRNRPVANLTLALNFTLTPDFNHPWSFRVVNLAIHLGCFYFIFLFLRILLALPGVPPRFGGHSHSLAWAAALLWALHPIQTQAVSYVIQRMTSLATLFYFMALYFYLKGRSGEKRFFLWSGTAFLLGLGSKEIVATLPLSILLMEWIFYRTKMKKLIPYIFGSVAILLVAGYLFMSRYFASFIASTLHNTFWNRNFTVTERLMTQPRVFLRYLSLTIFPWFNRNILDYNYLPSRSLVSPVSTLFALIFVAATIAAGFALRKKNALAAFCLLSFWLGHAIEGSLFNLELVFEHRMYLPSVFLIFGLVLSISGMFERLNIKRKHGTILFAAVAAFLSLQTAWRNEQWRDPVKFYTNNIRHTPQFYRPYHNLGAYYYSRQEYDKAIESYQKAIALKPENGISHFGMGQCFFETSAYERAAVSFEKALSLQVREAMLFVNLIESYLRLNQVEAALRTAFLGLKIHPRDPSLLSMTGTVCLYAVQNLGEEGPSLLAGYGWSESKALEYLEMAYQLGERSPMFLRNLSLGYLKAAEKRGAESLELLKKGEKTALEGMKRFPGDQGFSLLLAEIRAALEHRR